jgi:hypothetical protein
MQRHSCRLAFGVVAQIDFRHVALPFAVGVRQRFDIDRLASLAGQLLLQPHHIGAAQPRENVQGDVGGLKCWE